MSQMSPSASPTRWHVLAAFASVYLFWGGTYLGIRFALETPPPRLCLSRCLHPWAQESEMRCS